MTQPAAYVPADRYALSATFAARIALAVLTLAYFTGLPSGPDAGWRFDVATAASGLLLYLVIQGACLAYSFAARPPVWPAALAVIADALAVFACIASDPSELPPTLALAFIAAVNVTLSGARLAAVAALAGGALAAAAALQWRLDTLGLAIESTPSLYFVSALAAGLTAFALLAWRRSLLEAIAARHADQDRDTQLLNRRGFDNAARYLMPLHQRTQMPLVIMLASLDTRSATPLETRALQAAVRQVGELVRTRARRSDVAARLSADEFVFLLFDTSMAGSETLARAMVERFNTWAGREGTDARLTFSLVNTPDEPVAIEQLIARARSAVQRAQKHPSAPAVVTAPSM
jgi:diguanylate cyclase (GGDEF)-like protein